MTSVGASRPEADGDVHAAALETWLQPTLLELERVRLETVRKIRARKAVAIPLGLTAGTAFWLFTRDASDPLNVMELVFQAGFGVAIGWAWATHKLSQAYRKLYKTRVLPRLAAQFGDLTYSADPSPELDRLVQEQILPAFDDIHAEDAIEGAYRSLPIHIVELTLTAGTGKNRRTVFDGLLTEVKLPRALVGTTAVVSDKGMLGNLGARLLNSRRQRIRLEDPRFESAYEVYGDDQIAARALLTPAFMERFMVLGALEDFERPAALAQDNRLTLAMPKRKAKNLFEPPGYNKPAHSRQALVDLHADIAAVLRAVDAVIDLDQTSRKASSQGTARPV